MLVPGGLTALPLLNLLEKLPLFACDSLVTVINKVKETDEDMENFLRDLNPEKQNQVKSKPTR